jgi:L-ascorbate metabolism protein UlaG (beta-lactamase superfamily)
MSRRPLSDHFDGKKFFNPHSQVQHGFGDFLTMMAKEKRAEWPDRVENHPRLDLDRTLEGRTVAVTFVNHASVLLQFPGFTILTDPVWAERVSPFSFVGPKRVREPGIPFDKLPKIDWVLISHNHYDHMDLDTLKKLHDRFAPAFFVPLGDKDLLESQGIGRVTEMDWWDRFSEGEWELTFAPTQHFSSRGLFDRNASLWGSFMLRFRGRQIYFGGDAGYSPHYLEIFQKLGRSDLAFLPIGAYEPRWFMGPVHMNPEEAVKAHQDLQSLRSIGIHFGSFQLTTEAIDRPVEDLGKARQAAGLKDEDFRVLGEGQTAIIDLE